MVTKAQKPWLLTETAEQATCPHPLPWTLNTEAMLSLIFMNWISPLSWQTRWSYWGSVNIIDCFSARSTRWTPLHKQIISISAFYLTFLVRTDLAEHLVCHLYHNDFWSGPLWLHSLIYQPSNKEHTGLVLWNVRLTRSGTKRNV